MVDNRRRKKDIRVSDAYTMAIAQGHKDRTEKNWSKPLTLSGDWGTSWPLLRWVVFDDLAASLKCYSRIVVDDKLNDELGHPSS